MLAVRRRDARRRRRRTTRPPVELGTAFTPSVTARSPAIRFYKGTGNTGTHTGSLWSSAGTRLATGHVHRRDRDRLADRRRSTTPVALTAGTDVRRVLLRAATGTTRRPRVLRAPAGPSGPLTAPAGRQRALPLRPGGGFPTGSWNSTNYFVDVVFRYRRRGRLRCRTVRCPPEAASGGSARPADSMLTRGRPRGT